MERGEGNTALSGIEYSPVLWCIAGHMRLALGAMHFGRAPWSLAPFHPGSLGNIVGAGALRHKRDSGRPGGGKRGGCERASARVFRSSSGTAGIKYRRGVGCRRMPAGAPSRDRIHEYDKDVRLAPCLCIVTLSQDQGHPPLKNCRQAGVGLRVGDERRAPFGYCSRPAVCFAGSTEDCSRGPALGGSMRQSAAKLPGHENRGMAPSHHGQLRGGAPNPTGG